MRLTALAVVALSATAAFASEPGQPLDCSDWVSVAPGLTCSLAGQADTVVDHGPGAEELRPDNEGGFLRARYFLAPISECSQRRSRVEVVRFRGEVEELIGYFEARVNDCTLGSADAMRLDTPFGRGVFSPTAGEILFHATSFCESCRIPGPMYPESTWTVSIRGFATTFDVLQTFTPSASAVGFRVPYMPEGLAAADHFDTYYGPLTKPIDFGSAQPLACDYPAAAPSIGDYLEVPAPVPDPPAGQGYWYLTSVTYQGQTRYGRKASGGRLSGRWPGQFPACGTVN